MVAECHLDFILVSIMARRGQARVEAQPLNFLKPTPFDVKLVAKFGHMIED